MSEIQNKTQLIAELQRMLNTIENQRREAIRSSDKAILMINDLAKEIGHKIENGFIVEI